VVRRFSAIEARKRRRVVSSIDFPLSPSIIGKGRKKRRTVRTHARTHARTYARTHARRHAVRVAQKYRVRGAACVAVPKKSGSGHGVVCLVSLSFAACAKKTTPGHAATSPLRSSRRCVSGSCAFVCVPLPVSYGGVDPAERASAYDTTRRVRNVRSVRERRGVQRRAFGGMRRARR